MVESEAKRIIYGGRPDHLVGDSGRLRQSITHEVHEGFAAVGTNVVYGRIHEEGGRTNARTIVPVNASVLAFEVAGNMVFATRVEHPGSEIPARPFLAPALKSTQNEVRNNMSNAIGKVLP
jgi:phage gpG-like protein